MENTNSKLVEEESEVYHAKATTWCSSYCAGGMDYKQEKYIRSVELKKW